jgi:alkanesulfonate monooxygenase SsuD/methylene tetrahydromethanopterin reductase-like flavin-dependent oxidoreductase (luciferase family)
MLDILSGGRALFGMGRGLSRTEYAPFRIPMPESRGRFDEAAAMIVAALETGWIEGDGPHYPQPRVQLRPSPRGSFRDRLYCVAMSPESIGSVVSLGAGLMSIPTRPVPDLMPVYDGYRQQYRAAHGTSAPAISLNVNMYCHTDPDVARERSRRHMHAFFASNVRHYEMAGEHFAQTEGYQRYAETAELLRMVGLEAAAEAAAAVALFGTPDQILGQIAGIKDVLGDFQLIVIPSFGGLPYEQANQSLELFAKEVMPGTRELQG